MHPVRYMRKFGEIGVANAMYMLGFRWKHRPTSIDRMVQGVPKVQLMQIIFKLKEHAK